MGPGAGAGLHRPAERVAQRRTCSGRAVQSTEVYLHCRPGGKNESNWGAERAVGAWQMKRAAKEGKLGEAPVAAGNQKGRLGSGG